MAVEVYMPKMSDHMEAGEIIRWLAAEGERVTEGQPLLEITTDKVVATCDAPGPGILKGIRAGVQQGARVPVGETLAFIAAPDEAIPSLPPLGAPVEGAASGPAAAALEKVRAVPAARALAKELGIDLAQVAGSGPEGRIKVEDVRAYHEARQASRPAPSTPLARRVAQDLGVDPGQLAGTGPGGRVVQDDVQAFAAASVALPARADSEWLDLTPFQRITGQRMVESSQGIPHFALTVSADMANALALRAAQTQRVATTAGERLSLTAILVRVVAAALRVHPRANASFEQGRIRLHREINVGVAIGTEEGLVVPVIREADGKSLAQIARELDEFRQKAQAMRFASADLAGGTFTISNLGMCGVDRFTAIINPPQSAILAVGRIIKTPVGLPDDTVALRPLMSLTLSVDHRSLDGLQAARFLGTIREQLEQPYLLI